MLDIKFVRENPDIVKENITLTKRDWDSFETSWDFEEHPLIKNGCLHSQVNSKNVMIEEGFRAWSEECKHRFDKLKTNEEELNHIFIDIYGLKEELSSEVDDKDVTVRTATAGAKVLVNKTTFELIKGGGIKKAMCSLLLKWRE